MMNFKEMLKQNADKLCILSIVYIYFLIHHLNVAAFSGDDITIIAAHSNIHNVNDFINCWIGQYLGWSSRIIIEILWVAFCNLPVIVWKLIDPLFYVSISYVIYSTICLFCKDSNKVFLLLSSILVCLLYPIEDLSTSGWVAGGVTNLWNAVAAFYAVNVLLRIYVFNDEKYNPYVFFIALIYGANAELTNIPVLATCATLLIIKLIKVQNKVRSNKVLYIAFIISFALFVNALLCPGNKARLIAETSSWFPDFVCLSVFEKIFLGVTSTFQRFYNLSDYWTSNCSDIYLFINISILLLIYKLYRSKILLLCMLVPSVGFVLSRHWCSFLDYQSFLNTVNEGSFIRTKFVVPFVYLSISFAINIIGYYLILRKFQSIVSSVVLLSVFVSGYCSRFILGFSPTLYASSWRTFVYLNIDLIFILCLLLSLILKVYFKDKN